QTAVEIASPVVDAVRANGTSSKPVKAVCACVALMTVPVAAAAFAGAAPVPKAILYVTPSAVVFCTAWPVIVKTTRPVDVGVIVHGAPAAPRPFILNVAVAFPVWFAGLA